MFDLGVALTLTFGTPPGETSRAAGGLCNSLQRIVPIYENHGTVVAFKSWTTFPLVDYHIALDFTKHETCAGTLILNSGVTVQCWERMAIALRTSLVQR